VVELAQLLEVESQSIEDEPVDFRKRLGFAVLPLWRYFSCLCLHRVRRLLSGRVGDDILEVYNMAGLY